MFPTETLLFELRRAKDYVIEGRTVAALLIVIEALIAYYEWKQKPFMDNMTKPNEGAKDNVVTPK